MLMALGDLAFEISPFNPTEHSRDTSAEFAEKAIIGRRPKLEFTGPGAETRSITIRLLPEALGGLEELDKLDAMRISGVPQYFTRGDGVPFGWFVIDSISEQSTYLDAHGVGKVVDVTLGLIRSDPPPDKDYHATAGGNNVG